MAPLILSPRQRRALESLASHTPAATERGRAQTLLGRDEGETPASVAEALRVSRRTVSYWMERFHQRYDLGLRERLWDAPRPGRPRVGGGRVDAGIAEVLETDPRDLGYRPTVWTASLLVRYLRDHHGIKVAGTTVGHAIARLRIRWQRPRHPLARRPDTWRQSKGGCNAA